MATSARDLDTFSDDEVKLLYSAAHDHLLRAARKMDLTALHGWNARADEYEAELKRRFAIVPTVYAVAG